MNIVCLLQLDVNVEPPNIHTNNGRVRTAPPLPARPESGNCRLARRNGSPRPTVVDSTLQTQVTLDHRSSSSGSFNRTASRQSPLPGMNVRPTNSSWNARLLWWPPALHRRACAEGRRRRRATPAPGPRPIRNLHAGLLQPPLIRTAVELQPANPFPSGCLEADTAPRSRLTTDHIDRRAGRSSRRP